MTCFLCASPSTSDVPHNGHVTRQISLFKDLLNKEAFAKGFLAHSTYSLEYPTAENESDKSCATCLTRVGQVWELHREILELQGEMKTMLGRTLFEHGKKLEILIYKLIKQLTPIFVTLYKLYTIS